MADHLLHTHAHVPALFLVCQKTTSRRSSGQYHGIACTAYPAAQASSSIHLPAIFSHSSCICMQVHSQAAALWIMLCRGAACIARLTVLALFSFPSTNFICSTLSCCCCRCIHKQQHCGPRHGTACTACPAAAASKCFPTACQPRTLATRKSWYACLSYRNKQRTSLGQRCL